jgi:endonuclease YncB( thermonuclease family)
VVAYREEEQSTEVLQGNRLISLESIGDRDGQPVDIHGRIQDGKFVVKSKTGTIAAPLDVVPSDPWMVRLGSQGKVVSTRTGEVVDVNVTGGDIVTIQLQGVSVHARHYVIVGDKRQEVWMGDNDVPLKMRSYEDDGVTVDFVLKTPLAQAVPGFVAVAAAPVPEAPQARAGTSDR